MTAKNMEVYEQVADMVIEEDIVAGPKTPAFVELMSLQFTEAEARLALQIRTTGGTLDELAQKTKIKKEKLQKMLHTMADKGTVYYDSGSDPVYKIIKMAAPGFIETGLWCGIKYPFTVQLAKAINQVLKDWATEKLCKLGFPFAPVWAGVKTLPADASPAENLAEAVRHEGHWSTSPCPCRLSQWIVDPGNHCDHILETCIHTGDLSRWAVKHGMARELTFDELVALLDACNQDGLVHTLNVQNCICNCCNDCCTIFYGQNRGVKVFAPSPFIPQVDEESCNGCNKCVDRCPTKAIAAGEEEDFVTVDYEKCIGCGICVATCKPHFVSLTRRPAAAA
jgi:Pyruvate/2-oxoacid:ferredoxin oxidoreductase delta subunit